MTPDKYAEAISVLGQTDISEFELLCETIDNFPHGKDKFIERHWITNAIDCGSIESVQWILSKGVELKFRDDEGYMPLHSCIHRTLPNKYEILKALIKAGADLNAQGTNDYTALHSAAVRNDKKAMQILLDAGAFVSSILWVATSAETPSSRVRSNKL